MLQILALFAVSWLLVWLFEKKDLSVLGLMPSAQRARQFSLLFLVSALFAASAFLLRMYIAQESYTPAPGLTAGSVLLETWYQIRSVLTEELMFRGALLYILMKKIGQKGGIILSSVAFAVMHWFNAGVWGNLVQMAIVFAFTFGMGLLLAYAYAKTYSLWTPFAIHFGWNLLQNYIFPDTASGNHVFVLAGPPPEVTVSYLAFFTMLLLPKLGVLASNYFIVRKFEQAAQP